MTSTRPGPYDGSLPFLIQWTTPMAPGPADGAVVEWLGLTPPDPDRLARLLTAVGFVPSEHWPRRVFHEVGSATGITLNPIGEPEDLGPASWSMSWEEPDGPPPRCRWPSRPASRHARYWTASRCRPGPTVGVPEPRPQAMVRPPSTGIICPVT